MSGVHPTHTATAFPNTCPRCGQRILWLDRQSSPDLVWDRGILVGCARCEATASRASGGPKIRPEARERFRDVHPEAAAQPAKAPRSVLGTPPAPRDPRPIREILADEGGKVVSLMDHGLRVVEAAANFWDQLKPRKP